MAVYRTIHISFWQDPFVLKLTPEEKYFYIYLMTNSKTNQLGCYEISKTIMRTETGYNEETIDKLIDRFIFYNKIKYSCETDEVFLVNWHKYSWSKSPKVGTCIVGELENVKNQGFKSVLYSLCIDYGYSIDSLWIKKEKEKEKEKEEKEININNVQQDCTEKVSKKDIDTLFEQAWKLYPNKKGKGQISDSKKKKLYEVGLEHLSRAIQRYKEELKKEDWRKQQNGSTFFNSGYIDYLDDNFEPNNNQTQQSKSTNKFNQFPQRDNSDLISAIEQKSLRRS